MLTSSLYKRVVSYLRKRTRTYQDAEDLAQEAFIKCLERNDPEYKHIFTYAHDKMVEMVYKTKSVKHTEVPIELEQTESLEEQVASRERRSLVEEFLVYYMDEAPPAQKHVIASVAFQWPSPQSYLVKQVGLSKPLASYHYKEAFKHLTGYLAQQGAI
jgi:RNA polymerase sigma factor (sigma-70 family)